MLPYISIGSIALSYIFGILAHRFIQILGQPLQNLIKKVFISKYTPMKYDPISKFRNLVNVYQYGSERLNREIDFQYGLVVLFRSLILSIPLLGTSLSLWLMGTYLNQFAVWIFIFSVFLTIIIVVVYRRQYWMSKTIQDLSFEQLQNISKKRS